MLTLEPESGQTPTAEMLNGSALRRLAAEGSTTDFTPSGAVDSWSMVATRTVYFAHQSVGNGVAAGVEELARDCALPLRVVQTREPAAVTGPALVHFLVGEHRDFASKNAAMLRLLENPTRARNAIVVLKYCYADASPPVDTARMFEAYRDTVDTIGYEHPDVHVVHATIPLTTVESAMKSGLKQVLRRPTLRRAAVARHRYNELLRAEFGATEPLFDLAKIEARESDGSLAGFPVKGETIETLSLDNTDDGTHLNARGRRLAATALLDVLSDVIESEP
jgi:hypothetical protein